MLLFDKVEIDNSHNIALNKINKYIEHMDSDIRQLVSDSYHTFGELYYFRHVLFATILNSNKDKSWKSLKHHNDEEFPMFDGMFIAGINTEYGQFTFHIEIEYWDMFKCKEIDRAPEYDGHISEDIVRLLSLGE